MGRKQEVLEYTKAADRIEDLLKKWLQKRISTGSGGWREIGYHSVALSLALGLLPGDAEAGAVKYMKSHILGCFPNSPKAPRLSDPQVSSRQLISPYFCHFAFPPLIERGEMDFVLDQYRRCWGFALEEGRTTWIEVFDTRWSHCHQWSGCPTWQLSRYVLGLHPRFDLGPFHYLLKM